MSRRLRRYGLVLLLVISAAQFSYADHRDGSYCIGTNYIAFDLGSFMTPNLAFSHLLRLVRIDPQKGIYRSADIPMEDFDVLSMKCGGDQIEVSGQSHNLKWYERYTIEIADPKKSPNVIEHTKGPFQDFAKEAHVPTDGYLGIPWPRTRILPSTDAEHNYELKLSGYAVSGYGATTYTKAELVQSDNHGNITQSVLLYEFAEEQSGD
jgi:hypothetical protein